MVLRPSIGLKRTRLLYMCHIAVVAAPWIGSKLLVVTPKAARTTPPFLGVPSFGRSGPKGPAVWAAPAAAGALVAAAAAGALVAAGAAAGAVVAAAAGA